MKTATYKKVELLAPAGDMEKLEIAIHYGADAVYLAGKDFSLRNFSGNFTPQEMRQAIEMAHAKGVKVYVTCNTYSRNHEQQAIENFLLSLTMIAPDAVIVSDPGTIMTARKAIPQIPIHLSTQTNTTNYNAVNFWGNQGIERVNVARELSLKEIRELSLNTAVGIEAFVHGAMCISHSGRCLLSSFMAGRDGNRGMCCHPCRFKYAVVEEKRPEQTYPLAEDGRGMYVFNSRDLCMVEHLPEMIAAGITSLKIEGRMKGIHYLATAVKTYRQAMDAYYRNPAAFVRDPTWLKELEKISHREYCTGFYLGRPDQIEPNISGNLVGGWVFLAKVLSTDETRLALLDVRNKIQRNDEIEVLSAGGPSCKDTVLRIFDEDNLEKDVAQPGDTVTVQLHSSVSQNDIIRKVPL